jgi:hypothetical protein
MAFEYYGGMPRQPQENPFVIEQPQQQQGGMNPMQGLGMYQQLAGGGTAAGGAGGTAGGTWYGPFAEGGMAAGGGAGGAGAGSATGGAGGSAAGGGSSALASAGPWAALAAVIIANEASAKDDPDRSRRSGSDYYKDLLGGKVLEQDAPYWSQKIFGSDDKTGMGADMQAGAELATLDFSNFWDKAKDGTLGKILDIF